MAGAVVGFNWPNAAKVYMNHWDQQSVTYKDRSMPFRVASANGVPVMRVFTGIEDSIAKAKASPETTFADFKNMLDDAQANNVKLVLTNYLTKEAIESLAGHPYAAWTDAERDLATPGSAPWRGFENWITQTAGRFGSHPAAYSWEVTNEAGWMLGMDNGTITADAGVAFLDHFQSLLKTSGAKRVNAGGQTFFDPSRLTDNQVKVATRNVDILDHHLYPEAGDAQKQLDMFSTYVTRVKSLGRDIPAMLGEYGTNPTPFFDHVTAEGLKQGWMLLPWGFDSWDNHKFNDSSDSAVLNKIKALNGGGGAPAVPTVSVIVPPLSTSPTTGAPVAGTALPTTDRTEGETDNRGTVVYASAPASTTQVPIATDDPGRSISLATTGADVGPMAALGFLLLAIGGSLSLGRRREELSR